MNWVRRLWHSGPLSRLKHQRIDPGKVLALAGPEVLQAVRQAIAGDLACDREEVQCIVLGQENTHRRDLRLGLKVVVQRPGRHPADAMAGEFAHLDRCLGIHRQAQHGLVRIRLGVDDTQVLKDGVGLGNLFFGRVLATVWG